MSEAILLIEDEKSVAEAVAYALEREGFEVKVVWDGKAALEEFLARRPDLVILDLMLPNIGGWDLLRAFRRQSNVPVIMLTARAEEVDRVAGLEMGADDYVTKPFSMRELVARVRAVLRRKARVEEGETRVLESAGVKVDLGRHEVTVEGRSLELSPREYDLLAYLIKHAGRSRTREQILSAVWKEESFIDHRTVDVHVRWLRMKIETNPAEPQRLITVRGTGYKFVEA